MVINLHHDILALNAFQNTLELAPTLKGTAQAQLNYFARITGYCSSLNSNRSMPGDDTSRVYSPVIGSSTSSTLPACWLTARSRPP